MTPSVRKWLLGKAKVELREAREELQESERLLEEYQNRVADPSWNEPVFKGETESCWVPKVQEYRRYVKNDRKEVRQLEAVVKELEAK